MALVRFIGVCENTEHTPTFLAVQAVRVATKPAGDSARVP